MTTNVPTITCIIVWPTMLVFTFLIMTLPFLLEGIDALSTTTTTTSIITGTETPPLLDSPVWSMATLNKKDDHDDDNKENKSSSSSSRSKQQQQTTNMNLLTYTTPVSIRPHRLYALGLFQKTLSRENFLREKVCILQLLSADNEEHLSCIPLLGGQSGNDIDKEHELLKHTQLQTLPTTTTPATTTTTTTTTTRDKSTKDQDDDEEVPLLPKVLPGCVQYLKLTLVGNCDDIIKHDDDDNDDDNDNDEATSHDVVICKVEEMWTSTSTSTLVETEKEEEEEEGTNDDDEPKQQQLHHHLSTRRLRKLGLITEQGRIAESDK